MGIWVVLVFGVRGYLVESWRSGGRVGVLFGVGDVLK